MGYNSYYNLQAFYDVSMEQLKNSLLLSHCTSTPGVGIGGGRVLQNFKLQAFYDVSMTANELSTDITLYGYTG